MDVVVVVVKHVSIVMKCTMPLILFSDKCSGLQLDHIHLEMNV